MPGYKVLFVPGPTNMPFRVRQAMDVALEDHRAPDFPHFVQPLLADLKKMRLFASQFGGGSWTGLGPGEVPLLPRDISTQEIYAFDLQLP